MDHTKEVILETLARTPQKRINEIHRFGLLLLGALGCVVCSLSYAFNLTSSPMQKRYGLSQRDLTTISTVGLVFQYFVIPYAFLFDFMGPIIPSVLATIYFPLGTLLLALCFQNKITGNVVRLSVFNAMMGSGCSLFDLVCCMVVLSHFPTNKGPVTALLKTFTGLGSAIVGCLYIGYFRKDLVPYFYFLMAFALVVGAFVIAFMRLPPYHLTQLQMKRFPEEKKQKRLATKSQYLRQVAPFRRFLYGFIILILMIIFLPMQGALTAYLHLGNTETLIFAIITTVLSLLFFLIVVPLRFMDIPYVPLLNRHGAHYPESEEEGGEEADLSDSEAAHPFNERRAEESFSGEDEGKPRSRQPHHDTELSPMGARKSGAEEEAGAIGDDLALEEGDYASPVKNTDDEILRTGEIQLLDEEAESGSGGQNLPETEVDYLAPQYQGTFIQNLKTLELWSMWWTLFAVVGAEFVIIFNANSLLGALSGEWPDESLSALLTVLNGVGSAVGRLLMSYFEVWTQKRRAEDRIPITISLFLPSTSIIITLVLFLTLPAVALPLPYVVAALGNGFLAATIILVTRTIYAKDPAKHYNFCFTASMVASIAQNKFLYGEWYTVQAEKQNHADKHCYGHGCVQMPLLVMLGLCCSAFLSNVVMHFRYRGYCQRVLRERARLRGEDVPPEKVPTKWYEKAIALVS